MGTQKAVHYGVPMIAIPMFSDQMRNINIMIQKNMRVLLRSEDLDERSMDIALNALLHDPKCRIISSAIFSISLHIFVNVTIPLCH